MTRVAGSRATARHHWTLAGALVLGLVSALSGCSGTRPYQTTPDNNLHLRSATDSGSLFSSVRASLDIYRVGPECRADYEGTVRLNEPTTDVGIPSQRWTHLVFVFSSYSFWGNRSGTITYDTLLKPRPGYHYGVTVTYRDDMYHVVIQETPPNRSSGIEVDRRPLSACRSPATPTSKRPLAHAAGGAIRNEVISASPVDTFLPST